MTTKTAKIANALFQRGEELTSKQLAARYNTTKPRQIIYQLRNEGYRIDLNRRVDSKGRVTYKYVGR